MLLFAEVAKVLEETEKRSARLEMTDLLAELFKKTTTLEVDKLVYLLQGIIAPPYEGIDLGMGEKFAMEAIASAAGYSKEYVESHYKKSGDLCITAEELLLKKRQQSLFSEDMSVLHLYSSLMRIAKAAGTGSQELKKKYLTEILNNASPLEARFIIRFVVGSLRLGVGDPTILDALSVMKAGDKSMRESIERAYNVCADLGYVAKVFMDNSEKVAEFKVQPFRPLMPALAERLSTPEEIIKKVGKCAVEHKFDGFRLQCHKKASQVEIYSRKLEKMTHMFPDVVESVRRLKPEELIFEGEALAYNEKQKQYLSFQQTMHRRRKHGIGAASKEFPLNVFVFDVLYCDGKDLTLLPYIKRRKELQRLFKKGKKNVLKQSNSVTVSTARKLGGLFRSAVKQGLEGIVAKDLNAPYTAGKRKFAWIKLKKSYGKSVDTVDVVVVGYYLGKGARAEFEFGGLLAAVYNTEKNMLETIAKIGSGYTEEEMRELQEMLSEIKTEKPSDKLDYKIEPDHWVLPKYIVEVAFDEITQSPTHTCAVRDGKGLALRFPRMMKLRSDKGIDEITTTREVEEMYELQKVK